MHYHVAVPGIHASDATRHFHTALPESLRGLFSSQGPHLRGHRRPLLRLAHRGTLVSNLRSIFVTFGILDDITTDGGPEFTASIMKSFLAEWGVHHRLCSVDYPHGYSRAEIGVKTVKRALASDTPDSGDLDTDRFQRAMLTYRNTPDPVTKISPAIAVFARPIKDLIPVLPGKLKLHAYWDSLLDDWKATMASRGAKEHDKWSEHTHHLTQLQVGDYVRVQNQTGPFLRRWDKVGIVTEVKQFHQYWIRMTGSGRATLRNRKFLRKCAAHAPPPRHQNDTNSHSSSTEKSARYLATSLPHFTSSRPGHPHPADDITAENKPPPPLPVVVEPTASPQTPPTPRTLSTPAQPITPAPKRIQMPPRRSRRQCVTNNRPNYKE